MFSFFATKHPIEMKGPDLLSPSEDAIFTTHFQQRFDVHMRLWFKRKRPSGPAAPSAESRRFLTWVRNHPSLGQLNRYSVAGGVGIGLLVAFIPIPIQMILLTVLALMLRVNLAIAILVTWISNPLTFIPFNLFIYKLGASIINYFYPDSLPAVTNLSWQWRGMSVFWHELTTSFGALWKSYVVGLSIVSIISAILGYLSVQLVWLAYEFVKHKRTKD